MSNDSAIGQRRAGQSALLLAAFGVVGVMPVAPAGWHIPMAIAVSGVFLAAALTQDRVTVSLALFCAILAAVSVLNPWRFWPMHLVVPLLVYAVAVTLLPSLRDPVTGLRWGRFDTGTVGLFVLVVVGSSTALVLWYALARPNVDDLRAQIPSWPTWLLPLAGLGFAVVNAIIEEVVWRGLFWELLRRAVPATWAVILLQAASFGLIHIGGFPRGWMGVAMAALYGLFLGLIRQRSGGLVPPIIAHIVADAVIFAILVFGIAR